MTVRLACFLLLAALACGEDHPVASPEDAGADAGVDAAAALDAGPVDAALADAASDAGLPDAGPPFTGPWMLSETGIDDEGVIAYEVRYPLWTDGADKQRYLLLPEGTQIDTSDVDRWRFPVGTRAWKEFWRDGVHVETRFLHKLGEGEWLRVAYVFGEDGADARAVPEGMADARGTEHDVPSSDACFRCHRGAVDDLIGVSAIQLGGGLLETLIADGRLTDPPAATPDVPGTGVVRDALGYMHGNCGHCHNEDHALGAVRALRLWVPVGTGTPEETPAYRTALGAAAGHSIEGTDTIVVPGTPEASQLYVRMQLRDLRSMPPLGTELVDPAGSALVHDWIASLPE